MAKKKAEILLKSNPYPGLFIDIEGLDGSGATTQANLLRELFKKSVKKVFITKEPTDNIIGGLIRGALTGIHQLSPAGLQLLFVADRIHHLDREIAPILKNSSILISDRYLWSTVAFGSINVDKNWLLGLHRYCFLPDITILLKVSPKECFKRISQERFELQLFEKEKQKKQVWQTYQWLAKKFPKHIYIVDGEQKPEKVSENIFKIVSKHPKAKKLLKR
ncbi:MAG: dTMP kinase [Patescibacteria group bacterium]